MLEFLQLCFAGINIPFTLALILVFFYWCLFIIGAVGLDSLDVDLDVADLDVGADLDVSADLADLEVSTDVADVGADVAGDGDAGGDMDVHGQAPSLFVWLVRFFNVAEVPIMIWATFFAFFMWAGAILGTHYFNPQMGLLLAVLVFIPNFIVSLFLTKLATSPFEFAFKKANSGIAAPIRIVGKTCIITSGKVTTKTGQAEFPLKNSPLTLNVRAKEGAELKKGMEAVVVSHDEEKNTYVVVPLNLGVSE